MTTQTDPAALPSVPSFDLADRLRKALREADVSVQEMADYLEVSRNTVGRWINGHVDPSGAVVRLWALRTGVPHAWLRDGTTNPHQDGPGGGSHGVRPEGLEPPTFCSGVSATVVPLFAQADDEVAAA
jgi:DNA-binding XRE family transcriptional regulator